MLVSLNKAVKVSRPLNAVLGLSGGEIGSTRKVPLQVGKSRRPRKNTGLGLVLWFVKGLTDQRWVFGCLVDLSKLNQRSLSL